jgi:hypothetical protein
MLAVFGSATAPELARTLDLAGYTWKAVASPDEAAEHEPADGWQAFVVESTADAESAWAFLRVLRKSSSAQARFCCWSEAHNWPTWSSATICTTTSA